MSNRAAAHLAFFPLLGLLLLGCEGGDGSIAEATCERRDACGNLMDLTVDECAMIEEDYLATLGAQRGTCEAAWDECLAGEVCDDFRECHGNITRETCGCPDLRVAILDPVDGQTITMEDDADPSTGEIQYDFVVEASCLEDLEQVELFILSPVESSYGFGAPDARGRATIRVPLIPGENRFVARGMTSDVSSAEITVTVSP